MTTTTLKRWTWPDCYVGAAWPDYFRSGFAHHRGSDCLTESNFAAALRALGGESETVRVIRESHWAVGWVEWIAIHESDTRAIRNAEKLNASLEDYPALDDDDWSEREQNEANRIWQECFDDHERIAWMRTHQIDHDFASFGALRDHVRGRYFAGYPTDLLYY